MFAILYTRYSILLTYPFPLCTVALSDRFNFLLIRNHFFQQFSVFHNLIAKNQNHVCTLCKILWQHVQFCLKIACAFCSRLLHCNTSTNQYFIQLQKSMEWNTVKWIANIPFYFRLYVADVKMNHVRGAVSIRNMAQGSDPACVGKQNLMSILNKSLKNHSWKHNKKRTSYMFHLFLLQRVKQISFE